MMPKIRMPAVTSVVMTGRRINDSEMFMGTFKRLEGHRCYNRTAKQGSEGCDVTTSSDHFDGKRFFNPGGANGQPFWRVPRMLFARRNRWPSSVSVQVRRPPTPAAG